MTGWRQTIQRRTRAAAEQAVGPLARWGVSPNQLTVAGLLLNAGAGAILALGWLVPGGIAVLVASAFDLFDGALARVAGRETRFGAFFDSTLDRYSEALLFCGLLIWFTRTDDWLGALLCYLALLGSLMVSYARARAAEGLGLECTVGWFQRPERMIVLGVGLLLPSPRPHRQSDYPHRAFPIHRHPAYDSRVSLDGRQGTEALGAEPTSPRSPPGPGGRSWIAVSNREEHYGRSESADRNGPPHNCPKPMSGSYCASMGAAR